MFKKFVVLFFIFLSLNLHAMDPATMPLFSGLFVDAESEPHLPPASYRSSLMKELPFDLYRLWQIRNFEGIFDEKNLPRTTMVTSFNNLRRAVIALNSFITRNPDFISRSVETIRILVGDDMDEETSAELEKSVGDLTRFFTAIQLLASADPLLDAELRINPAGARLQYVQTVLNAVNSNGGSAKLGAYVVGYYAGCSQKGDLSKISDPRFSYLLTTVCPFSEFFAFMSMLAASAYADVLRAMGFR